jgi:phospholipid transport system substrate-binding protein
VHSNIDDDNPNIASVICSVKFNNQTSAVTVEYLLNKSKNGWKIYDVTIDDISVLSSFRIVFENVISSEGVEGLIMLLHSNELAEQIDQTINNHPDI